MQRLGSLKLFKGKNKTAPLKMKTSRPKFIGVRALMRRIAPNELEGAFLAIRCPCAKNKNEIYRSKFIKTPRKQKIKNDIMNITRTHLKNSFSLRS